MRMARVIIIALSAPLLLGAAEAEPLLSHTPRRAGICVVAQCDDAALLAGLAAQSRFLIYACHSDAGVVERLRRTLYSSGLLGRRVFLDVGDTVPFGEGTVDLVALPGGASEPQRQRAEAALAPASGVLVANGKTWRKPRLEGIDEWTHRWHEPDNNPLSRDTVFRLPVITQWLAKPYNLTQRRCTELIAGGRLVIVSRSLNATQTGDDRADIFICLNMANGRMLWKRNLPERFVSGQPNMILTDDTLYMALGPRIARIDPENGEDLAPIELADTADASSGAAARHVKWLALRDGVMAALLGPADTSAEFPPKDFVWTKEIRASNEKISDHGRVLVARDLKAGMELWRRDCGAEITVRMLAMQDKRLFYHAQDNHVAALDLLSGRELWRNEDKDLLARLHEDRTGFDGIVGDADRGMTAQPQALIFGNLATKYLVALDPATGRMLWFKTHGRGQEFFASGRTMQWVADGGRLYTGNADYDLLSGKAFETATKFQLPGCGLLTASPAGFFGTCGIGYDRVAGEATRALADIHKTPCDVGTFVAEGAMLSPGGPCTCDVISRGLKLAVRRGALDVSRSAVERERLWRADNLDVQPLPARVGDWPVWRGAAQSAASAARVANRPGELWRHVPAHPYSDDIQTRRYDQENRPTPPVLAGGLLIYGATDGAVCALRADDGHPAWTAWTAGPIYMPPAVADGRVYVGSSDGRAYCFEAATGRALWRFRAAPCERLLGVNGHISSNWPVHTGVFVRDGVAYFGAGLLPEDGAHLYAVDARDGRLLWQRNDLGDHPDQHNAGRVPLGGMAFASGRLWVDCLGVAATAIDPQNGALAPVPKQFQSERKPQGVLGKDLFKFTEHWMLMGGQRLLADHYERDGSMYKIGRWARYDFLRLGPDGAPQWPAVSLPETIEAPVWDDTLFVTPLLYRRRVEAWDMKKLLPFLEQKRAEGAKTKFPFYRAERVPLLMVQPKATEPTPMRLWGPVDLDVNAMALAADAVVAAHGVFERNKPDTWRLSALDRDMGKQQWTVDLPCEPLMDGLVIDGDGRIIVPLRNGVIIVFQAERR